MILNYITQIAMIAVPVFFALLGIWGITEFLKNKRGEGVVVAAIALSFAFTMAMTAMETYADKATLSEAKTMVESGAPVYLDGQEIDTDFVELGQYNVAIKDSHIEIYK